jgi:hypothetical protein
MKVKYVLFLLLAVMLAAAIGPAQAAPPACLGQYTYQFTLDFVPGDWDAGSHTYVFEYWHPDMGSGSFTSSFMVEETAPLHRGEVELRFYGLVSIDGVLDPPTIHPDQDTVMQLGWATDEELTRQDLVEDRTETTVQFIWDGGEAVEVEAGPITSLCAFDNPGRFLRDY